MFLNKKSDIWIIDSYPWLKDFWEIKKVILFFLRHFKLFGVVSYPITLKSCWFFLFIKFVINPTLPEGTKIPLIFGLESSIEFNFSEINFLDFIDLNITFKEEDSSWLSKKYPSNPLILSKMASFFKCDAILIVKICGLSPRHVCKSLAAKYPLLKESCPINERFLNPLRLIFKKKNMEFLLTQAF
jgi:hypothetical protein